MHEIGFVGRRHDDETGKAAEIGDVEGAGMGRAIGTDQPRAVHGKTHRQTLDGDVMHHLVVGALQKGRVDRGERLETFGRKACGEGDAVLLGDAHVEAALRKFLGKEIKAGPRRHRGGNGDDLVVLLRFLDQRFCIDLRVSGRGRLRLRLRACRHVELDDAMIFIGRFFGGLIALALLGDDVNEERAVLGVAHVSEHRQEMIDIVAVDRADIEKAELVEQGAAGDETAGVFLDGYCALLEERR